MYIRYVIFLSPPLMKTMVHHKDLMCWNYLLNHGFIFILFKRKQFLWNIIAYTSDPCYHPIHFDKKNMAITLLL